MTTRTPAPETISGEPIRSFPIAVPEESLRDLAERLSRARWPDRETAPSQGTSSRDMRALVARWRDGYDWRAAERALNRSGSSMTRIDGLDVHFLHVRSPEPDALPIVLTHGWPSSVLEFKKVIGPLADPAGHGGDPRDAFHVVVPSLPGFGFSERPTEPGWGIERIADAWVTLVQRLGYAERWVAQGGDYGTVITEELGHRPAPGLAGIHMNNVFLAPTEAEIAGADPDERAMLAESEWFRQHQGGYFTVQAQSPQTIGYSLADSPLGLAGWLHPLYENQVGTRGDLLGSLEMDDLLDEITMYWLTNTGASSARLYWEMVSSGRQPPATAEHPVAVPSAFSLFPTEYLPRQRRWIEARYSDIVYFSRPERGGHFAPLEQPAVFVEELRRAFAGLR